MAGYVVTVTRECGACDGDGGTLRWRKGNVQGSDPCPTCNGTGSIEASRREVDALTTARGAVIAALTRAGQDEYDLSAITESGGTIGPLPDGSTITVERKGERCRKAEGGSL